MKLAIGILTYNHPELSLRCLKSVERWLNSQSSDVQTDIAVFVLHNGSLDKNRKHLKQLIQNEITLHVHQIDLLQNQGFSGGANAMMNFVFAEGYESLLFLTNDTQLTKFDFSEIETADVHIPLIWGRKENYIDSYGGWFNPSRAHLQHIKKTDPQELKEGFLYVPGSAFLVKKNVLEKGLLFKPQLHTYWEDVEWSLRLQSAGLKITKSQAIELTHSIGKTCHKDSFYTLFLFQRNRLLISMQYSKRPMYTAYVILKSWLFLSWSLVKKRRWADLKFLKSLIYFFPKKRTQFLLSSEELL